MKLLSHVHINGNGIDNMPINACYIAEGARQRGYTHSVFGCHENFIMPGSIMRYIKEKYKIIPIRFVELSLQVGGKSKYPNSHLSFINIPEHSFKGFEYGCSINRVVPYAKEIGCKIVLCHPESIEEIDYFSSYIDGYEIINGLDDLNIDYTYRYLKYKYPNLIQFRGADYHVWELKGNMDLYTELPDNWFGEILL